MPKLQGAKNRKPPVEKKVFLWRLRVKTFRKFFFMIYSRRLRVNQER
jgi:hypothetical protein